MDWRRLVRSCASAPSSGLEGQGGQGEGGSHGGLLAGVTVREPWWVTCRAAGQQRAASCPAQQQQQQQGGARAGASCRGGSCDSHNTQRQAKEDWALRMVGGMETAPWPLLITAAQSYSLGDGRGTVEMGEEWFAYRNFFWQQGRGTFLEMGAVDGVRHSNTLGDFFFCREHGSWYEAGHP